MQLYSIALETTTFELLNGQHDGKCRYPMAVGMNVISQFLKTGEYHVVSHPVPRRELGNGGPHDHRFGHHGHGKACCGSQEAQEILAPLGHSMIIDAAERA